MKVLHLSYDSLDNPFVAGGGAVQAAELRDRMRARGHGWDLITASSLCGEDEGYASTRLTYSRRASRELWACAQRYDRIIYEFSPWSPLWVPREIRDKVVLAMWHRVPFAQMWDKVGILAPLAWLAQRRAERGFQHRVCLAPREGLHHIPPGVDDALFDLKSKDDGFALYLGRMDEEQKGLDRLLRCWRDLVPPRPLLVMAGRGAAPSEAMASPHVRFEGEVTEERKRFLLRTCSFVVMPSRYEGWGIAAMEAQAAGKVVIGWDIPGLRDALMIAPPATEEDFKRDVLMIAGDPELRKDSVQTCRLWARKFTWDACADRWEAYLQGVCFG